jgi:hypothetical protein
VEIQLSFDGEMPTAQQEGVQKNGTLLFNLYGGTIRDTARNALLVLGGLPAWGDGNLPRHPVRNRSVAATIANYVQR